ncbi:hypothetical protein ACZ90_33845 [Streptomyces albus subsp. albus]|nr:hypothetical protein ACZ90_33845 [Streptomyces albus subsp. albus]
MSAMTLALLLAAGSAAAVGAAALYTARGLRRQLTELRTELAESALLLREERTAMVPGARPTPADEIRAAVADALAEERERELAEARAFWAAQEARDMTGAAAADAPSLLGGLSGLSDDSPLDAYPDAQLFVPRQADFAGLEPSVGFDAESPAFGPEVFDPAGELELDTDPVESAELAAARRRHPSHPDFVPTQGASDHERTVDRLAELAEARTPLADVRPGPLGTLDVYVFADGTTMCMTPGHRETADRLAGSLREGVTPILLGSSGVSGAYALTFACGEESVYVLADRVIASL